MKDSEVQFEIEGNEWTPISYLIDVLYRQEYFAEELEIIETLEIGAINLK